MKAPAEGVAAPLEPSRQEFAANLEHEWLDQQSILDFRNWLIEKLWAAAAVSKNVKEAYDREHAWLNNAATEANCDLNEVAGAIMQFKSRIPGLEKEIAALRKAVG